MTNSKALKKSIKDSGYRIYFIASKLDITYQGLLKKINNESEFKASEIKKLCEMLNISRDDKETIFFA